jgi:hypothetical protein
MALVAPGVLRPPSAPPTLAPPSPTKRRASAASATASPSKPKTIVPFRCVPRYGPYLTRLACALTRTRHMPRHATEGA